MPGALGVAAGEGITEEVWRTGALSTMVDCLTVRVLPADTGATCCLAPVTLAITLLRLAALSVCVTLVTAALQRVPDVRVPAPADRPVVISNLTVSVLSTRSTYLLPGELPAATEGIPGGAAGTPADCNMVLDGAVGALAAGDGAGVDTIVVLAGTLGAAVLVLVTLALYTARVGISLVAR